MRVDHDQLLGALHDGIFEQPVWTGFLDRLRLCTGALYVTLVFRPISQDRMIELFSGERPPESLLGPFRASSALDPSPLRRMRDGRVYARGELLDPDDPVYEAFRRERSSSWRRSDSRTVRVVEPGGFDAWLTCAGAPEIGWAAISALMARLAPHLRTSLRIFATLERERFRTAVTSDTLGRLDYGWLTLDALGRIVDLSDHMEQLFRRSAVLRRGRYDRLTPTSPAVDRELTEVLRRFTQDPDARPRAINLSRDPSIELLIRPVRERALATPSPPVAIAYVSGDRWSQADRCDQLVDLFGLLPSEARLAWAMAQGTAIADAARELGLTVETARNYSKKIYAKTGSRGHVELVRNVLTSVLALT